MYIAYEKDPKNFSLDLTCPRCRHLVRAQLESGPIYRLAQSDQYAFLICRCPRSSCDVLFVKYDRLNNCVAQVFPYPDISAADYHKSIPEAIREDFAEAQRCYFGQAHIATVAMCRRAMQRIAQNKGAKGDNLREEIDDLFSKGLITKNLRDAAHEVRHFGNFGAHPRDDGLDTISPEDSESVLRMTNEFLLDLYIRPYETAELSKKRQGGP